MGILNKVLFPAYSSIQHNSEAIKQYYLRVIKINGIILFPMMTILIVLAEPVIMLGFGEEWQEAVFPLRMLAVGVIIHAVSGTSSTVMKSMGKAKLVTQLNILITLCVSVPAITLGAYFYGINGVAIGVVFFKLVGYFIYQRYIHRVIGVSMVTALSQLTLIGTFGMVSGVIVIFLHSLFQMPLIGFTLLGGLIITAIYVFYIIRYEKSLIAQVKKLIKSKRLAYQVN
jgi:PST family polysaccharide transporter